MIATTLPTTTSDSELPAPRRILMTADAMGGVWTYALELSERFAARGHQIALATMGARPTEDQRRQISQIADVSLFESDFRLEWMERAWADVDEAGEWLLGLQAEFGADVVHLNGYAHAALPWRARNVPAVVVSHSCVLSWWRAVHRSVPPAHWNEYRRRVREGLKNADAIVAPSGFMLDSLSEFYGPLPAFDDQALRVIPNGRNPRRFAAGPKHPFIFSAGRLWDQAKNIAVLDDIASKLPWRVYLAGQHEHPELSVPFAATHARMLGPLPERMMQTWLSQADIFALPARYEPFGLSILEAALSGCALLLGDIPSLREYWSDAAVFVDPDDPVAIHAGLLDLIRNPRRRRQLADTAYQRAQGMTAHATAQRYLDLYEQLLSRKPQHASNLL